MPKVIIKGRKYRSNPCIRPKDSLRTLMGWSGRLKTRSPGFGLVRPGIWHNSST